MKKCYGLQIRGQVQGVGFRRSAKLCADNLGLYGLVQNKNDGSIWIEVEGDIKKVKEFINWCQKGTDRAIVDSVLVNELSNCQYSDFSIIR